jgi:hypothetical protein
MTTSVLDALAEPDRETRCDQLSRLIRAVRRGEHLISSAEATALYDAQVAEARREIFDGQTYDRLWALLEHAPAYARLHTLAHFMLERPDMGWRGAAIRYLLRRYPAERDQLLRAFDSDPNLEVQDAIASVQVEDDPPAAIDRWERLLSGPGITHELAETVPWKIAYAYESSDVAAALTRYRDFDMRSGGRSVWGTVAAVLERRLESEAGRSSGAKQ